MSERAHARDMAIIVFIVMVIAMLLLFVIEFDRSQLRDLQRRVATLESERR